MLRRAAALTGGHGRGDRGVRHIRGHAHGSAKLRRNREGPISRFGGGLHRLSYRLAERSAFCRRAADRDAVRQHRLRQHHAGSRNRHRLLERRSIRRRGQARRPSERPATLSGHALPVLHQDVARGRARHAGLSQDRRTRAQPRRDQHAALPVQYPQRHARVERAFLQGGTIQSRSAEIGYMESRCLSRRGSRPLRRLPHAEEFPGRGQVRRISAWI